MEKKYDVAAMGELLIDFAMNGQSEQGNNCFEACPGGAPCNVLAMLGKLGRKTVFLGKVGEDQFGKLLKETIEEVGVDTTGLRMDQEIPTTLAFVHTFPDGDRDFSFYRKPGADMMLREEEVDYDVIRHAKIFHFGTLSMTHENCRNATKASVEFAKKMVNIGVQTIVYTDIATDGTLAGPNVNAMAEMASAVNADIIASGGVGSLDHIKSLVTTGVEGVIVGKALYTDKVDLTEAIKAVK